MSLGWKLGIFAILLSAVGGTILAGYHHYENVLTELSNTKTLLEAEKYRSASLQGTIAEKDDRLAEAKAAAKDAQERSERAREEITKAANELRETATVFANHDFANLVDKKAGLLTIKMTKATNAKIAEMHEASKAP